MDCSEIGNPRRLSLPIMLRGLLMRLLMASIGLGLPEIRDSSLRISSLVLISRMPDSYSIIICCICIADSISSSSSCCDSRSIAKKSASSIVFTLLAFLFSLFSIPHSAIGYNPQTSPLLWAIRHLPMKCPLCRKFSAARIFSAAADHTVSNGGKGT